VLALVSVSRQCSCCHVKSPAQKARDGRVQRDVQLAGCEDSSCMLLKADRFSDDETHKLTSCIGHYRRSTPARSPTPPVLYQFKTADEVSVSLADFVISAQNDAVAKRGAFKLAISGGSLAATLAKHLVDNDKVQWSKW
jgi:hypothetical protein